MNDRELLAVAAVLITITIVGVLIVSGNTEEPTPPGHVEVETIDIQPSEVGGETATLRTLSRLTHTGGTTDNITVEIRATDRKTGLLETEVTKEVGSIQGNREATVTHNISVPREGGYIIESLVYVDKQQVSRTTKEVMGVGTLTPDYARSNVEFHRFINLPSIEYSIQQASGGSVAIDVSTYLTNQGSTSSGDLSLVVKARQSDSNIVADESRIQVNSIRPGSTANPSTTLVVPDNYNYYLDAVLWRDNVIVGEERSIAHLDPTEQIDKNVTQQEVGLEVSDFEPSEELQQEIDRLREQRERLQGGLNQTSAMEPRGQPGFVMVSALLALLAVILIFRRKE